MTAILNIRSMPATLDQNSNSKPLIRMCNDTVYKVNFKFSLSSIFYIEEMLTIICNSSNGLYFVYLFAIDHSFHCNLDLETCPDLETCLELVLLPNYIDLSYKQ